MNPINSHNQADTPEYYILPTTSPLRLTQACNIVDDGASDYPQSVGMQFVSHRGETVRVTWGDVSEFWGRLITRTTEKISRHVLELEYTDEEIENKLRWAAENAEVSSDLGAAEYTEKRPSRKAPEMER